MKTKPKSHYVGVCDECRGMIEKKNMAKINTKTSLIKLLENNTQIPIYNNKFVKFDFKYWTKI